jgi:hypothetical protein
LGGDLMLNFAPQQRYRQAQFLSAATFGLILVAFAAPVGWRRFGGNRLLDSVRERLAGSERLTRWLPKRKSDSGARRLV